ncbi:MAG TPA: EFR1 family ferrodoxin [Sumerlaeia bacterium]|nr:EFR1 family ferrodoxin [Sumerlaeia bacterium]
MYRNVSVYYMTGTGNSYRAARWAGEAASAHGARARVVAIENARPAEEVQESPEDLLGLVMPTHGFTAPWHMTWFALWLPPRKGAHAFCVACRAGTRFRRLFFPGVSGTATFLIAAILACKGFRVRGVMGLDMPFNWMAVVPGLNPSSVAAIIARARPKTERFMERILSGERNWLTFGNAVEMLAGLVLLPVSVLYLLFGRFFLAKIFFASRRCTGCGHCAENCPVGAIRMAGGARETGAVRRTAEKKPRPYWRYNCENCMRCMAYCPEQAIEVGHSWAILLGWLTVLPVPVYCLAGLITLLPALAVLDVGWAPELLQTVYFYPAVFLGYYLFHKLVGLGLFNELFARTTLTRWYRRYREPDTQPEDIAPRRRNGAKACGRL